jgi:hypothetical protein
MSRNTSVTSWSGTRARTKLPLSRVWVDWSPPCTDTVTPASGAPVDESVTLPVTERSCARAVPARTASANGTIRHHLDCMRPPWQTETRVKDGIAASCK